MLTDLSSDGSSMPDYQEVVDDDNDETHMGTSFVHASADMFTSCFGRVARGIFCTCGSFS